MRRRAHKPYSNLRRQVEALAAYGSRICLNLLRNGSYYEPICRHPCGVPALERVAAMDAFKAAGFTLLCHRLGAAIDRPAFAMSVLFVHAPSPDRTVPRRR